MLWNYVLHLGSFFSLKKMNAFTKRRHEFREGPRTLSATHSTFLLISGEANPLLNSTFLDCSLWTIASQRWCFVWRQLLCRRNITLFILSVNLNCLLLVFSKQSVDRVEKSGSIKLTHIQGSHYCKKHLTCLQHGHPLWKQYHRRRLDNLD